jgi:hypothetical protein
MKGDGMKTVLIYLKDEHGDGLDKVVKATPEEWEALVKPAVEDNCPIDGSTVDEDLLDEMMERPGVDLKRSEVQKIERVIPLV